MQITAFKKGTKNQVSIIRNKAFANSMNLYFTAVKQQWEYVIHAGAQLFPTWVLTNLKKTIYRSPPWAIFLQSSCLSQHGMPTHSFEHGVKIKGKRVISFSEILLFCIQYLFFQFLPHQNTED